MTKSFDMERGGIYNRFSTNAINKVTSPPPSPSPLEGEGWVVKGIIAFVLVHFQIEPTDEKNFTWVSVIEFLVIIWLPTCRQTGWCLEFGHLGVIDISWIQ
jgi:hypothetical protein